MDTRRFAFRAATAAIKPLAVRVQAFLNVIFVDLYFVAFGQSPRFLPRLDFFLKKVYVAGEVPVLEPGVSKFVQQPFEKMPAARVAVGYLLLFG